MDSLFAFLEQLWLVWLVLMFLAIVGWAMWPGNRRRFEQAAWIPFKEDQ